MAPRVPLQPNLRQMPPSSAHQANVGIPGGINPRDAIAFPSLQGSTTTFNNEAARYPNPNNKGQATSSTSGSVPPPMPPVVSTVSAAAKATVESAVSDLKSTVKLNCPVSTTTSVSSGGVLTPVGTGVPAASNNMTQQQQNVISTHSALSSATVGHSVMSTNVLQGGAPIASIGAASTTTAASNIQQMRTVIATTTGSGAVVPPGAVTTPGNTTNEQQQNALLKQLLSGNGTTTTTTSP